MGTDKRPYVQRKAIVASDLERNKAKKQPYKKILIVCEGKKTEPNYFEEVKDHYELNTANVSVHGEGKSAPISVVEYGLKLFAEEKESNPKNPFDHVYFVFDRDQHESYDEAMKKIQAQTPQNTFFAINSVPSFEFWLLLHFEYTAKPFKTIGKTSSGKAVLKALKVHMPEYEKGNKDTFSTLLPDIDKAKTHAKQVTAHAKKNNTDNPSTKVHELIEFMENMKK